MSLREGQIRSLYLIGTLGVILALFMMPIFAHAQTDGTAEDVAFNESIVPPGTVSCFDYYSFGSVQVDLSTQVEGTVSGAPIGFSGALINNNPYPIVDGALYVKIFKSRGSENDGNGPDVVDQFLVQGGIAIPAHGSVPVSFQWKVPAFAKSGDYQLATFFTTSRKFNLLGLTFTDDVVGNTVPFTIIGEQTKGITFDKSKVTVGEAPYYFAAFPPRMDATSPVTVRARVENTVGVPQRATIAWTVYQWDGQLRENVVQEEVQQITISEGGTDFSMTVLDTRYPVYYVVGTISWNDSKSIIGARFVREEVNRTRLNFPGVTSFPLKKDEMSTLFSCLHNSGEASVISGGSLDLTLTDRAGNIIHEYRYDGDITGAMMGVASQFTPKKMYDYFTLSARLYQNGEFVDEANLVYDCAEINPQLCSTEEPPTFLGVIMDFIYIIGTFVGGLLALIVALWVYRRVSHST